MVLQRSDTHVIPGGIIKDDSGQGVCGVPPRVNGHHQPEKGVLKVVDAPHCPYPSAYIGQEAEQ
jgi:hypothetical protein